MKPSEKLQLSFGGLLVATVYLMANAIWNDILTPPKNMQTNTNARAPASLPAAAVALIPKSIFAPPDKIAESRVSTLNIGCISKLPIQNEAAGELIRLRGRLCGLDTPAKSLRVDNQTNGFNATLFATSKLGQDFTTDYIQLSPGENRIVFSQGGSGTELKVITVVLKEPVKKETSLQP